MSDSGGDRTFSEEEVAAAFEKAAPYLGDSLSPAARDRLAELLATAPPATPDQIARVRDALARPGARPAAEAS